MVFQLSVYTKEWPKYYIVFSFFELEAECVFDTWNDLEVIEFNAMNT